MSQDPQEIILWHNHNCATIKIYGLRTIKKEEIGELETLFQKWFAELPIDGVKISIISHAINHIITGSFRMVEFNQIVSVVSSASTRDPKDIVKQMLIDSLTLSAMIFDNLVRNKNDDFEEDDEEEIGQNKNSFNLDVDQEFVSFNVETLLKEIDDDLGGKAKP